MLVRVHLFNPHRLQPLLSSEPAVLFSNAPPDVLKGQRPVHFTNKFPSKLRERLIQDQKCALFVFNLLVLVPPRYITVGDDMQQCGVGVD